MKTLLIFCLSLLCLSAMAGNQVTATITVTNATFNGYTFTVNGVVRTWTNIFLFPTTQIPTNSDVTGCGSKTNLLNEIALNAYPLVSQPSDLGSNIFSLTAISTNPLVVTVSGTYATISYTTQTVSTATAVRVPVTIESLATQTNVANGLTAALNSAPNGTALDENATVTSQLVGTNKTQTVFGVTTVNNASSVWKGFISQVAAVANILRGGYWSNAFLDNPVLTNGLNYGSFGFSSPGGGGQSEQFGAGSVAHTDGSTAIGNQAQARGTNSTAVGELSETDGISSTALGNTATGGGDNSIAIGTGSEAGADNSIAIGNASFVQEIHTNSIAVGFNALTTDKNQIMLGSPGLSTVVQNNLFVQTNLNVGKNVSIAGNSSVAGLQTNGAYIGTNNFVANSDIAFTKLSISSLANSGNAAVAVGTNVFFEVSGPTGAFAINGIASGRDGKLIIVKNSTGQTMTIANASGTDPTAANRILTGTGADVSVTSNPGMATLIYSASDSRWILMSHN